MLKIISRFIQEEWGTKVSGYVQVGSKGQVDPCLGVNQAGVRAVVIARPVV